MKYLFPLFFFIACTQRGKPLSEAKENELKKYFVSRSKQIDDSSRVDSFALVKLDTITEQEKYVSDLEISASSITSGNRSRAQ